MYVTIGSGHASRMIVTSIDEPGYVVSEITEDGYLAGAATAADPPNAVFDSLQFAQPVRVVTPSGKEIPGVFAGLSVHLQPGRINSSKDESLWRNSMWISARQKLEEVHAAGIDLLDPVSRSERREAFRSEQTEWRPEQETVVGLGRLPYPITLD